MMHYSLWAYEISMYYQIVQLYNNSHTSGTWAGLIADQAAQVQGRRGYSQWESWKQEPGL